VFIPAKEVISEVLDFDEMERKFYDDLLLRGQQVIEELRNTKRGLQGNYMCLLTMLLRLRQGTARHEYADIATDHIDLLKDKAEQDKDAINDTKASQNDKIEKDVDDDLASMMSGLGIESKCAICFTMYLRRLQN
jgi:SNF2 family DNA or RNA helicase